MIKAAMRAGKSATASVATSPWAPLSRVSPGPLGTHDIHMPVLARRLFSKSGLPVAMAALCMVAAHPDLASAAVLNRTFDIEASAFTAVSGPTAQPPTDPLSIEFTVAFDPAGGPQAGTSAGLTVLRSNFAYVGALQFAYNDTLPNLVINNVGPTPGSVQFNLGEPDIGFYIGSPTGLLPFVTTLGYSEGGTLFSSSTVVVTATDGPVEPVPEPPGIFLITLGAVAAISARIWMRSSS